MSSSPVSNSSSSPNSVRASLDDLAMGNLLLSKPQAAQTEEEPTVTLPLNETRSLMLRLAQHVGELNGLVLSTFPLDTTADSVEASPALARSMAQILTVLLDTAASLHLDLETCIHKKMALNAKKYPVELCRGKAGKYTDYSKETGITKESGQSTAHLSPPLVDAKESNDHRPSLNFIDSLPSWTTKIREFAEARHWSRFHLPRNLTLALLGEVGELAELVQWNSDVDQALSLQELDKLGQELADVSIYLIRLADICGVSLEMAVVDALSSLNAQATSGPVE